MVRLENKRYVGERRWAVGVCVILLKSRSSQRVPMHMKSFPGYRHLEHSASAPPALLCGPPFVSRDGACPLSWEPELELGELCTC